MKIGFGVLLLLRASFSFAAPQVQIPATVEICKDESRPILSYSEMFRSSNEANELYLDRYKGQLKGLWLRDGKALTMVGLMTSKEAFYLCSYDHKIGKQPLERFKGRYTVEGIEITDSKNNVLKIPSSHNLLPPRDYSVETKENNHAFQIIGRITEDDPDTCNYTESFFNLLGGTNKKANRAVNGLVDTLIREFSDHKNRTNECLSTKSIPNSRYLAIGLMYAGPRFVSSKIDVVNSSKTSSDWTGRTFNYDRIKNKELDLDDILDEKGQPALTELVKKRMIQIYGESGRFKSMEFVNLSFTPQTLVVSFAPVDELGWYMSVYRLDIPVPLDLARPGIKSEFLPR